MCKKCNRWCLLSENFLTFQNVLLDELRLILIHKRIVMVMCFILRENQKLTKNISIIFLFLASVVDQSDSWHTSLTLRWRKLKLFLSSKKKSSCSGLISISSTIWPKNCKLFQTFFSVNEFLS